MTNQYQWMKVVEQDGRRARVPVQPGDILTLTVDLRYFGTPEDKLVNKRRSIARKGTEFTVFDATKKNLGVRLPSGKELWLNPKRSTVRFK